MYERPNVSDEDLGIRAFQIRRAKAVERAIQLIRHAMGASWSELTEEEIEELEWVLGELWAYEARARWDDLHFSHFTIRDAVKILTLGSQMRRHARNNIEILREVEQIIRNAQGGAPIQAEEAPE